MNQFGLLVLGNQQFQADVNEIHKFIKDTVQSCAKITDINVLYGGSVNAENSKVFSNKSISMVLLLVVPPLIRLSLEKICINYIHQMEIQE